MKRCESSLLVSSALWLDGKPDYPLEGEEEESQARARRTEWTGERGLPATCMRAHGRLVGMN